MQPAEYYLKELLFDYDCVTIPGLGGFIMQLQPARISKAKNRINPPSRYPSFNSLLNHDDGLFISCISRAEQLSYRDAGSVVNDFAENCKKRLSAGEIIILEGIGELSAGTEGVIRFRPSNQSNFFTGAFGMEAVNLYPLTRTQNPARMTQRHADRMPGSLREKKPASVAWTLALSMPIILFLLYGIIFPSSIHNIYTNYSGIISDIAHPADQQPDAINYSPVTKVDPEVEITPEISNPPKFKTVSEVKTETLTEPTIQESLKYYIIGGCFENEANAGKFMADLINRGFHAEKAGTNNRGHVRISYESFSDKASAIPYLQKIRIEENASAWLLKY
jgi:hypothetical protein